jgi:hypothetical protein
MPKTLHVFSGSFPSEDEARQYSEEQWERPAPDDSWSEEAFSAWEDRNPSWRLKDDLDVYLNSDFIETIHGPVKNDYLATQLAKSDDVVRLLEEIPTSANTLVLIMSEALGGFAETLRSTSSLRYHGQFQWNEA